MKTIKSYPNDPGDRHCLQACVKMILNSYFPDKIFSNSLIDNKTGQIGGNTWTPPTVVWLRSLGLRVKLYSIFDYENFSLEGEEYLKKIWDNQRYSSEKNNGALNNLLFVQKASMKMVKEKLWVNEFIDINLLRDKLRNERCFAIGKTISEWLVGNSHPLVPHPHYVLLIKEYSFHNWLVNDPGLPEIPNKVVPKTSGKGSIFGDIILVEE